MNWKLELVKLIILVVVVVMLNAITTLVSFETAAITAFSIIMCNQIFLNNPKD